ncbi:ribosome small subunit-dependent GTPase A [Ructibacterium gallinarum]|uniref:Small ribosomal subunit biogenesis GTPase RsgA n=1 Tax=Ructibacterium gallinarum TaxID=2779355 RepID=A0A9D5M4S9_9FIRM|nr:ribosome small subunit-dependent GTPase A [Ructibacterium gallinarum]MBE5039544.1 ribosome small subunit-dependent GTPase A [Ructibacterium gallinarum]
MKQLQGRITKGIGGFYYVDTAEGMFECRARGIFRKEGLTPLVGDVVTVLGDVESMTGTVDAVEPRKNVLIRPPVANVTQMAVVVSTSNPAPNLYLLDKLIASAEYAQIQPLICWNKTDLDEGSVYIEIYEKAGFDTLRLSAETGWNISQLRKKLKDQVTVFAGNSGVGKSSLLNQVLEKESFETGAVSGRVDRGRHTTRHSELAALPGGGYIIDTPGFGTLDFSLLNPQDCAALFREFAPFIDGCQFRDCSHTVEKGCCVLEALREGKISQQRHESYCRLVQEIREAKPWK